MSSQYLSMRIASLEQKRYLPEVQTSHRQQNSGDAKLKNGPRRTGKKVNKTDAKKTTAGSMLTDELHKGTRELEAAQASSSHPVEQ